MVIAAENEEDAIHLSFVVCYAYRDYPSYDNNRELVWRNYYLVDCPFGSWSETPTVKLIVNNTLVEEGVVCASFNAS